MRACACACVCVCVQMLHDAQLYSIRSGAERMLFTEAHGVHFVTKRYAALAATLHVLMAGYDQDDPGKWRARGRGGEGGSSLLSLAAQCMQADFGAMICAM